jgi:hypothetical protein
MKCIRCGFDVSYQMVKYCLDNNEKPICRTCRIKEQFKKLDGCLNLLEKDFKKNGVITPVRNKPSTKK